MVPYSMSVFIRNLNNRIESINFCGGFIKPNLSGI